MRAADGGVPALLLEPRHRADAGPHAVPLGSVHGAQERAGAAPRLPGTGGPRVQTKPPQPPVPAGRPQRPAQALTPLTPGTRGWRAAEDGPQRLSPGFQSSRFKARFPKL